MSLKRKILYGIMGLTCGVAGFLAAKTINYLSNGLTAINNTYCASPLAKSLEEEVNVNLGIIIERALEKESKKIEDAFAITTDLYKKEFNIHLGEEHVNVPIIPEYNDYSELYIPKKLTDKDAFIFMTRNSHSTIAKGIVRTGVAYNSKTIVIQDIELQNAANLSALLSHEIAHLFYAQDLPSTYKDCLMSGPHREVNNICEPTRKTILFYRDRIW